MIKFEFMYDGSTLNYPTTLLSIYCKDICLESRSRTSVLLLLNSDKQVAVAYDNEVSARDYVSYIAEQAGGFCKHW